MMRSLLLLVLLAVSARAQTFAWNADTDTTVTGYDFYVGTVSGAETLAANVGNVVTFTLAAKPAGTYFAVVRAYNAGGYVSAPSNEVKWIVPVPTPTPSPTPTPAPTPLAPTNLHIVSPSPTP